MLFFDEIQNIDGWERFARRFADKRYKVWITGSNAKMLSKEMLSTLGGRFLPIEVYPFSFPEYLNSKNIPFDEKALCSTKGKTDIMRLYNEYICWGGLPECIGLKVKRNYISAV